VYGKSIKASDLPDGVARFFPIAPTPSTEPKECVTPSLGLPKSILLPILESLREDVAEILEAFQDIHLRMVGGSLLIVYEGDWERAAEGVKLFGLDESSDIEERENNDEDERDDEDDEDDGEEEGEEGGQKRPGPPYTVKLIDFAHTRIKLGQGPDQGVLLGLSTVRKLLDGRIEQVRTAEV
jgi:inositol-polyphosphate multikinase